MVIDMRLHVKKALDYLGLVLLIVLLCLAGLVFAIPHFDWRIDAVMSGSMKPAIQVGGLVVTRPLGEEPVAVGDIITFHAPLSGDIVAHRIVEKVSDSSQYFRTKGDANEETDPIYVPRGNIIGKVVFNVPYLGYASQFVKNRLGFALAMYLPGLIIIALEIRSLWTERIIEETERQYRIIR
jgi:signal peptidase I